MDMKGYLSMDIIMDIKGYLFLYVRISSSTQDILVYILIFIPFYPDIYPAGYSIRFSPDPARRSVLLNRTLFCMSCSATG